MGRNKNDKKIKLVFVYMQRHLSIFIIATLICCFSCNSKGKPTNPKTNAFALDTSNQTQSLKNENKEPLLKNHGIERDTHGLLKQTLKMDWFFESDTAFAQYYCNSDDINLEYFLQYLKDSNIKGYYRYNNTIKVPVTGKKIQDSIILFDNTSKTIPNTKLIIKNDTAYGNFVNSNDKINHQVKLVQSHWYTGDIESYNYQNIAVVFRNSNQNYRIPISKYFDKHYNYSIDPLLTEFKDGYFYILTRIYNKSLNKNEKGRHGWGAYYHYLLFAKFNNKGEIVKDQVFKIDSDIENIRDNETYGSISEVMKDSLNVDVFHLDEDYRDNITIDRKNIEKGMIIKKVKTKIAKYIYDSLTLKLDKEYHLNIKFKQSQFLGEFDQRFIYDSANERDNKDIKPLSNFCKDLARYEIVYENNKISSRFNGDEIKTGDYNFDGYKDIYIKDSDGSGVHNYFVRVWTYNKKTKKYELDKFLSSLPICELNEKKQCFYTCWNDSGLGGSSIYKKINGKITLFESEDSRYNKKNGNIIHTKGKLIKNKWVETKTIEKNR